MKHFLLTSCDIFTRVMHEGHVDESKNHYYIAFQNSLF